MQGCLSCGKPFDRDDENEEADGEEDESFGSTRLFTLLETINSGAQERG